VWGSDGSPKLKVKPCRCHGVDTPIVVCSLRWASVQFRGRLLLLYQHGRRLELSSRRVSPQRVRLPGVLGLRSKKFEFMFVNRHSSSSVLNEANVLCLFSESLSAQHELVLSDETEGASGDSAGS
jgi:hypothetical protein